MGRSHTQLKVMGVLLAGIGLFVTTTPSAPDGSTLQASAARSTAAADPHAKVVARARLARVNARPHALAAGIDVLDGGGAHDRTTARATTATPSSGSSGTSRRSASSGRPTSRTASRTTSPTTRVPVTTTTTAPPSG